VVNTHRTFDLAAAAGHAAIEYLGHFVNLVFGEITVSPQIASHPTRWCKVPAIHVEQQVTAITRDIARIARGLVDLATDRATRALAAGASVEIKQETIVAVAQNGCQGGQETLHAIMRCKRALDVV
jgi:hypothetical protein